MSGRLTDVELRALAETPPKLKNDKERLAYFRGFLAGARTSEREGEQLEKHKDLVFRIAAEVAKKSGRAIGYEEAVSAGYMGLLNALRLRRSRDPDGRVFIAKCIRHRILDERRALKNLAVGQVRGGEYRKAYLTNFEGTLTAKVDHAAPSLDVEAAIRKVHGMRERLIVKRISEGHLIQDIAAELHVHPSRVSQLLGKIREKHGDMLEALAT